MSLGKKLFIGSPAGGACPTDTVDVFEDSSGVALYSLDYDASDAGGNYDGTPTDVTFGIDGQINWGASFNGSSSYVQTSISQNSDDVSISFWMQADSTGGAYPILMLNNRNGVIVPYAYGTGSNSLTSNTQNQNILLNLTTFTSQLNHIVINMTGWASSYTSGAFGGNINMEVFVNGSSIGTTTNKPYGQSDGTRLGRSNGSYFVDGKLDQVRIFNKALSQNEINTLAAETACVYTSTTDIVDYQGTNLAYYKLDNNAEDETGNYDGTESNITYEFGRYGTAAVFNGSSSYIDANLQMPSTTTFTFSCWFYKNNSSSYHLIGDFNSSATLSSGRFRVQLASSGDIDVGVGNGTSMDFGVFTPTVSLTEIWRHIAVTVDGTSVKAYIDGSQVGTADTLLYSLASGVNNFAIGAYHTASGKQNFNGLIDQVRIFDSALDATAVENLYNEKPEVNTSNFETVLYEGNGGSQYISNVGFKPDLVWMKCRNVSKDHRLYDSIRGATHFLEPNNTGSEGTASTSLTSFNANGFTLGAASTSNSNNDNFVAWCWKAGGDAVNNTNGNITSQVSANQDAGFSIVKWTSTGSGGSTKTVGHGLDSTPEMIILKNASSSTASWRVFHNNIPSPNNSLALNSGEAAFSFWPSVSSTNFGLAASVTTGESSGASGQDIIAYCFHSVSGYQKLGNYSGGTSGYEVTLDFTPRFVLLKNSNANTGWLLVDSQRGANELYANLSNPEDTSSNNIILGTNKFTLNTTGGWYNSSGNTYIYLAIA